MLRGARARLDREGNIGAETRIKRDGIEYGAAVGTGAIAGAVMGGPAGALAGTLIGAGAVTVHLLVSHPQANAGAGNGAAVHAYATAEPGGQHQHRQRLDQLVQGRVVIPI